MASPTSQRTKQYRAKLKALGIIRKMIWVTPEQWEKLKPIIDAIKESTNINQ